VKQGIIYVDVPENVSDFLDEFAQALEFKFTDPISYRQVWERRLFGEPIGLNF
jgi:hypothetical protein